MASKVIDFLKRKRSMNITPLEGQSVLNYFKDTGRSFGVFLFLFYSDTCLLTLVLKKHVKCLDEQLARIQFYWGNFKSRLPGICMIRFLEKDVLEGGWNSKFIKIQLEVIASIHGI